jgi:tRNA G18 (ribose-2'-O)-methylase SpoU
LAQLQSITSRDDPRIAPYANVRERDLVGRGHSFIAEGDIIVRVLAGPASCCRMTSLLLARRRLRPLAGLIEALPSETCVYVAEQDIMDQIAGFHIHRGLLAVGERPEPVAARPLLRSLGPRSLVVVALGISNHDNIGGLFRNAAAFGADAVLIDHGCCDPFYRKAIRVSAGAVLTTPMARLADGEDALAALAESAFEALAFSPGGGERLGSFVRAARSAVLFGAEGSGLPSDILARARAIAIPMAAGWDSLNVAAASAVALFALCDAR